MHCVYNTGKKCKRIVDVLKIFRYNSISVIVRLRRHAGGRNLNTADGTLAL